MLESFKNRINSNFPFLREKRLLIAISGGLDSVVLTYLCHSIDLEISLAHCNFKLRNDESDGDEAFVVDLANQLGVEVFVQSFNTQAYADDEKLSVQMAARKLRYNWFRNLKEDRSFDYILTAHHADDNLETFLINLIRGTGIDGLAGIPEVNDAIVRPLLIFSRADIEVYAKENNLVWREDSSNASTKYLRNALRHCVIPELKKINPSVIQNSSKTIAHLKDSRYLVSEHIASNYDSFLDFQSTNELRFNCEKLVSTPKPQAYLYELFKDYGFKELKDIEALLSSQTGKVLYSKSHQLLKNRDQLILTEIATKVPNEYQIDLLDGKFDLPDFKLYFKKVTHRKENSSACVFVDLDKLKFPLKLRKWKEGDLFYPIGMKGKKKLSKYFKDLKLSLNEKQDVWLLCSDEAVIWVLGYRADDRFKVSKNTYNILKIEFTTSETA